MLRPLDGVDADAAHAHDDGDVTRPHPCALDRRAPAGGDAAADQAGLGERDLVGDLHAAGAGHDRVLREGRDHGRLADVLPVLVHPEGAVELAASQQHGSRVAEVLHPAGAPAAPPAPGNERQHDVIAGRHAGDRRPHRLHDPGSFVAAGHRQFHERHVAGDHVVVGVAQAGRHHLDEDLAGLGLVEVDLGDLPFPGLGEQHGGVGLHGRPPIAGDGGWSVWRSVWPGARASWGKSARADRSRAQPAHTPAA